MTKAGPKSTVKEAECVWRSPATHASQLREHTAAKAHKDAVSTDAFTVIK